MFALSVCLGVEALLSVIQIKASLFLFIKTSFEPCEKTYLNIMRKIFHLIGLVILSCATLSCSKENKSNGESSIVGKWTVIDFECYSDEKLIPEKYEEDLTRPDILTNSEFDFHEDGIVISYWDVPGKYSFDSKSHILTIDNDDIWNVTSLSSNEMIWEQEFEDDSYFDFETNTFKTSVNLEHSTKYIVKLNRQ